MKNFNWYKIAQEQQTFDFYNDPKYQGENPRDDSFYREWAKREGLSAKLLDELIATSEVHTKYEIEMLLNQFGFDWEEVKLKAEVIITVKFKGSGVDDVYLITDFEDPSIEEAKAWVSEIFDHNLQSYVEYPDFEQDFWKDAGNGSVLYHATDPEYKEDILKHGLKMMNKTRSMSNRSMGSAVFTSDDPDSIAGYGPLVFEIDIGQMKNDGYMPPVSMEEPLEDAKARDLLAWKLGVRDYNAVSEYDWEGLADNTVAIYGDIPPKYLKVYSE